MFYILKTDPWFHMICILYSVKMQSVVNFVDLGFIKVFL